MLGVVFIIVLLSLIAFGNKDQTTEEKTPENEGTEEISLTDENDEDETNDKQSESETDPEEVPSELDDVDVQQVDSTDDNVIVAYTGNWAPVGTVQEEPHTTNYNDGSDDRNEIKRAVSVVTGIEEADMTEHWVGNDGDQKVVATISSKSTEEVYQVYLSWINEQGWQVTKVERIKEYKKQ